MLKVLFLIYEEASNIAQGYKGELKIACICSQLRDGKMNFQMDIRKKQEKERRNSYPLQPMDGTGEHYAK